MKPAISNSSRPTSPGLWLAKKTVLLVDVNSTTRGSRSKIMRTLGVTVHCAASATGARQKLETGSYDLVLVDLGSDREGARSLVEEIRSKNSRQLVAFLIGSPLFVATSLGDPVRPVSKSVAIQSVPVPKQEALLLPAFDFGQKIRDAESKQIR